MELAAQKAICLDTLRHAYFLLGEIGKTMETEAKAITIGPNDNDYKKTLDEFKTAKSTRRRQSKFVRIYERNLCIRCHKVHH